MIWKQAGGHDNNKCYFPLTDEHDNTLIFATEKEAKEYWKLCSGSSHSAAFVVNATASANEWI